MPRRSPSRLDKRREAEAVEALEKNGSAAAKKKPAAKKKAAKKTAKKKSTRRSRKEVTVRSRLVWAVFSGSMKEEARFPYDQREAAEEKIEQLRSRSKKMYFIQPVKEPLTDSPATVVSSSEPEPETEPEEAVDSDVDTDDDDDALAGMEPDDDDDVDDDDDDDDGGDDEEE